MKQMELKSLCLGNIMTNCYLLKHRETGGLIVVDPAADAERIIREIENLKGCPQAILLTHGHFDHFGAVKELKEQYPGLNVYLHEKEVSLIRNPDENLSSRFEAAETVLADVLVRDGEKLLIAGFSILVCHTPGHTPGSCCYYLREENCLFSGDTLFAGSCGRTDFPGGSSRMMRESLAKLMKEFPEDTEVFPGHNGFTTIKEEKRYNPFV